MGAARAQGGPAERLDGLEGAADGLENAGAPEDLRAAQRLTSQQGGWHELHGSNKRKSLKTA